MMINNDTVADTPTAIDDVLPSRKKENIILVGTYTSILFIDVYCKDTTKVQTLGELHMRHTAN